MGKYGLLEFFVTAIVVISLDVKYFITTNAYFLQPDLIKSKVSVIKQGNLLSFAIKIEELSFYLIFCNSIILTR
jgi:hypothetical protein